MPLPIVCSCLSLVNAAQTLNPASAACKGKRAGDVVGRAIDGLAFYGWLALTAVDERASWMVTTTTRSSASMTTYTRINHRHGPRMNR